MTPLPTDTSEPSPTSHPPAARVATIGWAIAFGCLCCLTLTVGVESALHFLGPAIDGPFQLYNSLRRIWVGQQAGVDFQFFHGMGIPFLHYPLFRLFGGTFFASEITRQVLSAVLYPLTLVIFLKFFLRDWVRTLAWATIVMIASIALRLSSILVAVNSLLGIRSTLPTLLPVVLCLPIRRAFRNGIAAVALGGALLLGTEQGIAAVLALVLATIALALCGRAARAYAIDAVITIAGGIATLVVGLIAMGGMAGMRGALVYNFRVVPMDQYWYFGAPPNLFIEGWSDIPAKFASMPRAPTCLLIGLVLVAVGVRMLRRSENASDERKYFALTFVTLYGLISCASLLGTFANAYVQPLIRVLLLVSAVYLGDALPKRDRALQRTLVAGVGRSVVMLAAAWIVTMIVVVPYTITTAIIGIPHVVFDHVLRREGPVYSGIWPAAIPAGQAILDSRRGPDGKLPTLWSTYSGLLEARNGLFNPSFDYIIHALGPDGRARYLAEFKRVRPQLVQTVSPEYTQYESWIEDTSWDLYAELLRSYTLIGSTPWSLFWERTDKPMPAPRVVWQSAVKPGATSIALPPAPVIDGFSPYVLVQAEIEYRIHNPLHALPIVGASPRYLLRGTGILQKNEITLDPYVTTSRIPLILLRGHQPVLSWRTASLLPGARLEVRAIRLSIQVTSPKNASWFAALVDEQSRTMSQ